MQSSAAPGRVTSSTCPAADAWQPLTNGSSVCRRPGEVHNIRKKKKKKTSSHASRLKWRRKNTSSAEFRTSITIFTHWTQETWRTILVRQGEDGVDDVEINVDNVDREPAHDNTHNQTKQLRFSVPVSCHTLATSDFRSTFAQYNTNCSQCPGGSALSLSGSL